MPEHLTTGSTQPPKVEGKLRLYSMEFCPYAQRARLVLLAKNIPHDIVNINLVKKPEWYLKVHPEGKVPALDTGSQIIVESLDICDFLDEQYPENPLYPKDPEAKKRDQELIQKIGPVTTIFFKYMANRENLKLEDLLTEITPALEVFEKELASRGTTFFGGEKPGMVDYMFWPWGERAPAVGIAHKKQLPFAPDQFKLLRKWRKAMREDPHCNKTYHEPEILVKLIDAKLKNEEPDYDNL